MTSRRQSNLSTHAVRQVKFSWTCWAFSRNLKPTSGVSVSWKALLPQRRVASTVDVEPSIDPAEVQRLRIEEKLGATEIARGHLAVLGVSRAAHHGRPA